MITGNTKTHSNIPLKRIPVSEPKLNYTRNPRKIPNNSATTYVIKQLAKCIVYTCEPFF
jgi:hypothetical protein